MPSSFASLPSRCPSHTTLYHRHVCICIVSLANCKNAMRVAHTELNVPLILTPDDLCHKNLDERSAMTYLSYFMKQSSEQSSIHESKLKSLKPIPSPRATVHESNTEVPVRQTVEEIGALLAKKLPFGQNIPKPSNEPNLPVQPAVQKPFVQNAWSNSQPVATESASTTSNGRNQSQKMVNIQRVTARGKGLKFVAVKRPATFTINAPSFEQDDLSVIVTAPSGREIPTRMDTIRSSYGQNSYEVEYITPEVGEHVIEVLALGKPIAGNPFHSSGYDAAKIKVGPMPSGLVSKSVEFESKRGCNNRAKIEDLC